MDKVKCDNGVKCPKANNWRRYSIQDMDKVRKLIYYQRSSYKPGDENEAYVLLNSLPESYKEVKNGLKYGRDSVKIDTIILSS